MKVVAGEDALFGDTLGRQCRGHLPEDDGAQHLLDQTQMTRSEERAIYHPDQEEFVNGLAGVTAVRLPGPDRNAPDGDPE